MIKVTNAHLDESRDTVPTISETGDAPVSVSELPDSWHEERIGDAYRFTRKPKDVRYADYATIPFVSMNLIPQGGVLTPSFKEKQPNEISSGTYFEKGDLLLSKITPSFENGKQAIASNLRPHLVSPLPK